MIIQLLTGWALLGWALLGCSIYGQALGDLPAVVRISPTAGPEGTRVEIIGRNLGEVSRVVFGATSADFKIISAEELIAIVPHRTATSLITVIAPQARAASPFPFVVSSDPRVPDEASYKSGYVNSTPAPEGFSSVLLWGIAIADTRVHDYSSATIEVAWTQLSCQTDGREVVLNDDHGSLRGGLYRRNPWFGINDHERLPMMFDLANRAVILRVGQRPDKVWHFWAAVSPPDFAERAFGGLHSEGAGKNFSWRVVANGHGLLAESDDYVWCGR
jgi:hypothetical protein